MKLPKYPSLILFVVAYFCCGFAKAEAPYPFHIQIIGEGQPMIMIPGLISGAETWIETALEFSDTYESHILTMPGFAGVPPQESEPYVSYWKSEIIRYITDHEFEDVILVGHSLGGFLSLWIGTEQIPNISSLIIVDAMPFFAGVMNPNAATEFDESSAQAYFDSFSNFSEDQILSNRKMVAQGMTKNEDKINLLVNWAKNSDLKTEAWSVTEMMSTDLREDLSKITNLVAVFAAYEANPHFPKSRLESMYEAQYQHLNQYEFYIVDDARHFIMFDQSELLHAKMRTFLNSGANTSTWVKE